MNTFGVELEFDTGADDLIAALHDRGFAGDATLHGYHCDCPVCRTNREFPLTGQTDSSCSGEIISDVMTFDGCSPTHMVIQGHDPRMVFEGIQDAAIEVDAEPGLNSGLHVHVGRADGERLYNGEEFMAYLKWEPLFARLGSGRWEHLRDNNVPVRGQMLPSVASVLRNCGVGLSGQSEAQIYRTLFDSFDVERLRTWLASYTGINGISDMNVERQMGRRLIEFHQNQDRHSYLNLSTHHPTWEFRLWNSTRSAWRMEMFARTSIAMMDADFTRRMLDEPYPQRIRRETLGRLSTILGDTGHQRAAELVDRQRHYLSTRAANAPSTLTNGN